MKRARRAIENSEDSETDVASWSPRRRLTMADDVMTGTPREFQVVGYHREVGAQLIKIINKLISGIGELFRMMGRLIKNEPVPVPEPATMMSTIYDSISSAISSSNTTSSTPTKATGKKPVSKPVTKSAPLRNPKIILKSNSRAAIGGKSIMEDLAKGGSSSSSDSDYSATAIYESIKSYLPTMPTMPSTSKIAELLPTLVAGLVFTTAGTIVGYMWNTEFAATASSYVDYFLGTDGNDTIDADSFNDAATSTSEDRVEDLSQFDTSAAVVTPGRH